MSMEVKTTIYDIFGYVLVGVVAGVASLVAYAHTNAGHCRSALECLDSPFGPMMITLLLGGAYVAGHAISTLSSFTIETFVFRASMFARFHALDRITSPGAYKTLRDRFRKAFGYDLTSRDFRLCVCAVESRVPPIYQTAFVFLAFYGMARNISFVFVCYSIWEAMNSLVNWQLAFTIWSIGGLVLGATFFYHYLRFLRYFRQEIIAGFLVSSDSQVEQS